MKDKKPQFDTVYETLTEQARTSRVINRGFGSDGNEPPPDAINRVTCRCIDCEHHSKNEQNECLAESIELTFGGEGKNICECITYSPDGSREG